ncbi:MAG: DUF4923 family protein [Prevotellaceae bacterium]|nr:DUF4923 family protein [Prevotellaceae bacterium]
MKKTIRFALAAMFMLAVPMAANAQLSDVLKKISSGSSSSSSSSGLSNLVTGIVSNLLGANKLTVDNLVGTWDYTEPCIVMESDNVLSKIGGDVASSKMEDKLDEFLQKVGFKAGDVVLQLDEDKTGSITIGGKKINVSWDVDDSDVIFTILKKDLSINADISNGSLQLAMSMDKMLDLLEAVCSGVSNIASSASILTNLLSKYDGLYLGLKFSKE